MMIRFLSRSFLILVLLLTAYPFVWMLLASFKSNQQIYKPDQLIPSSFDPFAFQILFSNDLFQFNEVLARSILLSSGQAFFACLVTAAAGYAIAKGNFRGRKLILGAAILLILFPKQAMSLFLFEWMSVLGLTGNVYGFLLSGVASGLGVVFFTQVFRKVPTELVDLSLLEGQSHAGCFISLLPLMMPALITYGMIHFVLSWQEHLLPLLVLGNDQLTLPLALAKLSDSSYRIPEAVGLAAGVLAMVPMLFLFGFFFRRIRTALSDWVVS
jgi:ABC-type glycerol-3-phosphate transport system permease component